VLGEVHTVTITRVGTNQKYAEGWEVAFGGKKPAASSAATPSTPAKAPAKKAAKKAAPSKKAAAKKATKKGKK
jgi:hypothetical protein